MKNAIDLCMLRWNYLHGLSHKIVVHKIIRTSNCAWHISIQILPIIILFSEI